MSWRPCWRYNTKEYFISSIVDPAGVGAWHCPPYPERLIANQEYVIANLNLKGFSFFDTHGTG